MNFDESDLQIDGAILAVTVTSWRKIALVVALAQRMLGGNPPIGDAGLDLIAKRIEALVQDGRLLAQGDIKNWRYSEVRKPS